MVTMCRRRLRLMWSIMEARVVVLPEPVVPVTSTMPRGSRASVLDHRGQVQLAEVRDAGDHVAHGDGDGAALPVDVHTIAPAVGRTVGEVDLVGLAEPADLLLAHERGCIVLGVLGRAGRLVQFAQFAVHADDRRAADLEVKVGGARLLDLQQQLVDVLHQDLSRAFTRDTGERRRSSSSYSVGGNGRRLERIESIAPVGGAGAPRRAARTPLSSRA